MNVQLMGRRAAQRLFDSQAGADPGGVETITPRVIVRESMVGG